MKYILIALAAAFVVGDCRRHRADGDEVSTNCVNKDVDSYMDKVLEKVRQELSDPMRLPPRSTVVELSEGVLWGMSELKRVGQAEVICEGETITIKLKVTTDELKARYTWTKERKNKSPLQGYVVIISDDFQAEIVLVIDQNDNQKNHPRLEKFVINKFKEAKIEITGMSYVTWALGEVTTLLSGIFQRVIASTVQGPIEEALERKMGEITLD